MGVVGMDADKSSSGAGRLSSPCASRTDRGWSTCPRGEAPFVGPEEDAVVRIEGLARSQGLVRWDGEQLSIERTAKSPPIYVNGKRLQARSPCVRATSSASATRGWWWASRASAHASGRRALTHQEFRERLGEELARAARRGRPTRW